MAIIKQGILNGFNGKVGSISGKKHYEKDVILSNSNIGKSEKSINQISNMDKMFQARMFGSLVYEQITKIYFSANVKKSTLFAEWIKENYNVFDSEGFIDQSNLILSNGPILFTEIRDIRVQRNRDRIRLRWLRNWDNGSTESFDIANGLYVNFNSNEINWSLNNAIRSDRRLFIDSFNGRPADTIYAYLWFYRSSDFLSSNNTFLQS